MSDEEEKEQSGPGKIDPKKVTPLKIAVGEVSELVILVVKWRCPGCRQLTQLTDPAPVKAVMDGGTIQGDCKLCGLVHEVTKTKKALIVSPHDGFNRHARRAMGKVNGGR